MQIYKGSQYASIMFSFLVFVSFGHCEAGNKRLMRTGRNYFGDSGVGNKEAEVN